MHAVIETPIYLTHAKAAGVSKEERENIATLVARDPLAGVVIPGTGDARKLRVDRKGKGKSGGYRIITLLCGGRCPVFLLALVSKNQRADLSHAERNALKVELLAVGDDYRSGVRKKVKMLKERDK